MCILMMEATEDRASDHLGARNGCRRAEPVAACRRLKAQTAVGAARVVAEVGVEDPQGMALVPEEHVVEALATEGADQALADGIGARSTRRRDEPPRLAGADAFLEVGAVDGVAVVNEEAGCPSLVSNRGGEMMTQPLGGGMRGDAKMDDGPALERDDDESVEEPEAGSDDGEEVAGPRLVQVVLHEGAPTLSATAIEAGGTIPGDGAGRDIPAELLALGGDAVFAPERILTPHPANEGAEVRIDRWPANGLRSESPEEPEAGSMPADEGLGLDQEDGVQQSARSGGDGGQDPALRRPEERALDLPAQPDQLLAEQKVLGEEERPWSEEPEHGAEEQAAKGEHGRAFPALQPGASAGVQGLVHAATLRLAEHVRRSPSLLVKYSVE